MTLQGGCFCGAIRYEIGAKPRRVTHCHCVHCRRLSGAPLVTWVECDVGTFRFTEGTTGTFESRPRVERRFCPRCGTQLTYRNLDSDTIDVTAASLDAPESVTPEDHVWTDRQLAWLHLGDDLPRYALGRPIAN